MPPRLRPVALLGVALLVLTSGGVRAASAAAPDEAPLGSARVAASAVPAVNPAGGQAYREPVVLTAEGDVLEVRLSAREGAATLDTVDRPVRNALLFGYELLRGSSSNGQRSGSDLYPAPTLNVYPGQTLIVHLENELRGLTIRDYADPSWTPAGDPVPVFPSPLRDSPYNNHVHGIHTSPAGNSDNVLLDIPAGMTNTYTYEIPLNHPEGLYWYHTHRHMLTAPQVYRGLVGMLVIGRVDGGIPAVAQAGLPVRTMALQYNYVFNRAGGQAVLNNPFWPAMISTLEKATPESLADGSYPARLTPINFRDSAKGTTYLTAWWDGPLSVNNNRGVFQYLPTNLQSFVSADGRVRQPAQPALPESQRDVQYTVNGQFQPVISTPPGQTEIWVLGNFTDAGYLRVAVQETATGRLQPLSIVAQDGNPYTAVQTSTTDDGTTLLIPPASRYAIAVTMPATGGLRLVMPPYTGSNPVTTRNPGILYTNDGTATPPAVTGTITVDRSQVSYADGFFVYPTQTLLDVAPAAGSGTTVPFPVGQQLGAYTSFVDLSGTEPDVTRTLRIGGGFANENASMEDPNAFAYQFDGNQFPNIPLLQPRLNTTEEWRFVNRNNDEHPIHIHVNDYQVVDYRDPVAGIRLTNLPWGQDNQNTPAPSYQGSRVDEPGLIAVRTLFQDYTGAYVLHCHRLNHEDGGLMAIINVIPEVTAYAIAVQGSGDRPTKVLVVNQATGRILATVTPFPGWSGPVDVAMGDIDGDRVLDLVVGAGAGQQPRVRVFSGASVDGGARFATTVLDRLVFDRGFRGGLDVATGNIDGRTNGDSVIVGSGPGMRATVVVLASGTRGATARPFARWHPYGRFTGGVSVAAGLVDASGRELVVTGPGPGMEPLVRTWLFSLMTDNVHASAGHTGSSGPVRTSSFPAFDPGFRGGVNVATGWVAGQEGGFARIVAGQASGGSEVSVWSSGSRLTGHPDLYVVPLTDHSMADSYDEAARFEAFPGSDAGVDVTTSANARSADLIVSGVGPRGPEVRVLDLARPTPRADHWTPTRLDVRRPAGTVVAVGGR